MNSNDSFFSIPIATAIAIGFALAAGVSVLPTADPTESHVTDTCAFAAPAKKPAKTTSPCPTLQTNEVPLDSPL